MGKQREVIKTGLIGKLDEDNPFIVYCNEKDKDRGKFLFRCCEGCKHNLPNNEKENREK